jgi:hypothetical protein
MFFRDGENLYLQKKIAQMSYRIGQLEEALAEQHPTLSDETHPLLADELLKIKSTGELHEGEKMPTAQGSNMKGRQTRPEGDEVNVGSITIGAGASFHRSEVCFPSTSWTRYFNL